MDIISLLKRNIIAMDVCEKRFLAETLHKAVSHSGCKRKRNEITEDQMNQTLMAIIRCWGNHDCVSAFESIISPKFVILMNENNDHHYVNELRDTRCLLLKWLKDAERLLFQEKYPELYFFLTTSVKELLVYIKNKVLMFHINVLERTKNNCYITN